MKNICKILSSFAQVYHFIVVLVRVRVRQTTVGFKVQNKFISFILTYLFIFIVAAYFFIQSESQSIKKVQMCLRVERKSELGPCICELGNKGLFVCLNHSCS